MNRLVKEVILDCRQREAKCPLGCQSLVPTNQGDVVSKEMLDTMGLRVCSPEGQIGQNNVYESKGVKLRKREVIMARGSD